MREQLVSEKVAILAKEKDFPQTLDVGITCRIKNKVNVYYEKVRPVTESDLDNSWSIFEEIYPTQSVLQKWLREEHKIDIVICPIGNIELVTTGYYYEIPLGINEPNIESDSFETYEEALEVGLQQALTLIK